MQFGYGMGPDTTWMRQELTDAGVRELQTPEEVDSLFSNPEGATLLVINSVCGCAAGNARPGLIQALEHKRKPDQTVTVFAGQDKEATARAREYFTDYPPSSPAFVFFKEGKIKAMLPREQIEGRTAQEVSEDLVKIFDRYCGDVQTDDA